MHRKKDGKEYWVFPGGHTEENETPEETLRREIWEESSLRVTKVYRMYPYTHDSNGIRECFFTCEVEAGEPRVHSSGTEKNTRRDRYNPEWVAMSKAKKLTNLYPEAIKRDLLRLYENQ